MQLPALSCRVMLPIVFQQAPVIDIEIFRMWNLLWEINKKNLLRNLTI